MNIKVSIHPSGILESWDEKGSELSLTTTITEFSSFTSKWARINKEYKEILQKV